MDGSSFGGFTGGGYAIVKLVINGAPRTKKNSLRRLKRGKRIFTVPSAAHEAWEAIAVAQLRKQWRTESVTLVTEVNHEAGRITTGGPIQYSVNLRALVYRERAGRADLLNYLAAVSDALEKAGVLVDDRLVASVDGSRLGVDRARPRVEIELTVAT